jgi:hypothetical protein
MTIQTAKGPGLHGVSVATPAQPARKMATAANRPNPALAREYLKAVLAWKRQQAQLKEQKP